MTLSDSQRWESRLAKIQYYPNGVSARSDSPMKAKAISLCFCSVLFIHPLLWFGLRVHRVYRLVTFLSHFIFLLRLFICFFFSFRLPLWVFPSNGWW
ncbi:hypothetical protein BDV34DRAFT_205302 [Aspergillus parasiticus]|uniref:Uncharacterized protein n=1 Tax=Aspergillus parasiticus TaxID=5067 RepID=A0A5N6D853_ASPPA|nr:hypothetical protein BDV34DRAFT_205302 [Aspergillus parasiticus]